MPSKKKWCLNPNINILGYFEYHYYVAILMSDIGDVMGGITVNSE